MVPAGFAHGFIVLSETAEFLYKTTDYYAPEHERCILWNDPDLNIRWPIDFVPQLSQRTCKASDSPMPAYMTSFKSGATPTAVKASVIIPTKNPGRSFAAFCLQCSQETGFSFDVLVIDSGSKDGTVEFVRGVEDQRLRLMEISPSEFGHGKTRNLAVSKPPANTQCSSLMMHSRTICIGLLPWWPWPIQTPNRRRVRAPLCVPEASPYTKRDLDGHFGNFAGQPVVWLDDKARYDRDEPYRQRLHFFSTTTRWCVDPCGNRFPIPMSILPRIRSGPSKSSKPDGKGLCA